MQLFFECKQCHSETERELERMDSLRCGTCGSEADADAVAELTSQIAELSSAMASLRGVFRFEVLLESDDLPAPFGFDHEYVLPEDELDEQFEADLEGES